MCYLIRRREQTSREELVAHWFGHHMPPVIEAQRIQAEHGKLHASRYIATLFEPDHHGQRPWDGIAQLWFPRVLPRLGEPIGADPTDSFQEKAEPYVSWPTTEYVVIDGDLPAHPNGVGDAYPSTRSGFYKVTYLVKTQAATDFNALFDHWLDVHIPNVTDVMEQVGGLRYVVTHSIEPEVDPYAGMAELYFSDESGWDAYRAAIRADGMEQWVDGQGTVVQAALTEMIGIA
jgi:hypothetical protein|tara:strand:+ start:2786 stop:3481 length:696 start_codon:yes stop_codon:yes gene_type:complete